MSSYKMPWLRQRKGRPEVPLKLPIELGPISNGEVFRPASPLAERATQLALEKADEGARRHGIDRREFLASTMGMATTMWAINMVNGCGGDDEGRGGDMDPNQTADGGGSTMLDGGGLRGDGGYFDVPKDTTDPEKCMSMLKPSDYFIFDIQTHHVTRANDVYDAFLRDQQQFTRYCMGNNKGPIECFGREEYVRLMFLESDTTVAVLSGLPAVDDANNPITNREIAEAKAFVDMLGENSERLINHHMVLPNQGGPGGVQGQLDAMERTLQMYKKVGAWKTYPAWAPENTPEVATGGYFYDDPATGIKVVEKGLSLGVGTFCIHKGLPIPAFSTKYNDPEDMGRIAKMFPQAKFIVYHSGFGNQNQWIETPYTPGARNGSNGLITSMLDNGIKPNSNLYAELGTTWQLVSTILGGQGLSAAAHLIGKLLKYVGEDNVVWGTDSIWYGSPQSQIMSFLNFQISPEFQQMYGYPALTPEIKRKIIGLNAAKAYGINPDKVRCGIKSTKLAEHKSNLDSEYGEGRWTFNRPMLTTRRGFWEMHKKNGFRPG